MASVSWWELFCRALPKGTEEHDKVVSGLGSAAAIEKAVEQCRKQLGIAFSEGALKQTLLGTLSSKAGVVHPSMEEYCRRVQKLLPLAEVQEQALKNALENFDAWNAPDETLIRLYQMESMGPSVTTKAKLRNELGITFNGIYHAKSQRGAICVAFGPAPDPWKPCLVKYAEDSQAVQREYRAILKLAGVAHIVGPVSLLYSHGSQELSCVLGQDFESSYRHDFRNTNIGLLMPMYPSTMSNLHFPVSERDAFKAACDLQEALQACHSKGICHNDMKPSNVFLTASGEVVLGDFGSCTAPYSIVFETTFGYWPGGMLASPSCDMFCLAASLLEVLGLYIPDHQPKLSGLREAALGVKLQELQDLLLGLLPLPQVPATPGTPPQRASAAEFSLPSSLRLTTGSSDGESVQGDAEELSDVKKDDKALMRLDLPWEEIQGNVTTHSARKQTAGEELHHTGKLQAAQLTPRQAAGISASKAKRLRKKKREGKA